MISFTDLAVTFWIHQDILQQLLFIFIIFILLLTCLNTSLVNGLSSIEIYGAVLTSLLLHVCAISGFNKFSKFSINLVSLVFHWSTLSFQLIDFHIVFVSLVFSNLFHLGFNVFQALFIEHCCYWVFALAVVTAEATAAASMMVRQPSATAAST